MSALARRYLAIPGTAAATQSVFAGAENLIDKDTAVFGIDARHVLLDDWSSKGFAEYEARWKRAQSATKKT